MMQISRRFGQRRRERGQAMVEFCLVLSTLMLLVLIIAEMGFAFGQNMSLELGTREGSRVGASLANGVNLPLGPSSVDPQIVASVERALTSAGANVKLSDVEWVRICKADSSGGCGTYNEWHYSAGLNNVGGVSIHFTQASSNWAAASRNNALPSPDSVGVMIRYHYHLQTPLAALLRVAGFHEIVMTDATVMALQPTS